MRTLGDWKTELGGGNFIEAAGCRFHYARRGAGPPLVLVHGWPEFWLTWRKNIPVLAEQFDVIVPDLRGFGESRSIEGAADTPINPDIIAADLAAFLDGLSIKQAGFVGHDVGAQALQSLARAQPDKISSLFFFNCPYPGIGRRWADADSLPETWYQYFNQLPLALELAGYNRDTCRLYIGHILSHWSHDPKTFDDDLEHWIDNFTAPGALEGGFAWYRGVDQIRRDMVRRDVAGDWPPRDLAPIPHRTRVYWGAHDPVLRATWMDRLGETFSDLSADIAPDAGHFVHYEKPDAANREIAAFFKRG